MVGRYRVSIKSRKINYEFEIKRNITILKGDSSTGKTTLINLVNNYKRDNSTDIISDIDVSVLPNKFYELILENVRNNLILIDEDNPILKDIKFAKLLKNSDNYFLIITRKYLDSIPYSYKEIYQIKTVGKTNYFERVHNLYEDNKLVIYPKETIIIEDKKSGYQFFKEVSIDNGINVISSEGKSNIANILQKYEIKSGGCVVADGAAFGNEIEKILPIIKQKNIKMYLPESFEYILLKSNLLNERFESIIYNIEYKIDSKKFFSWENFFESELKRLCNEIKINYTKSSLDNYFLKEDKIRKILDAISTDIKFNSSLDISWV